MTLTPRGTARDHAYTPACSPLVGLARAGTACAPHRGLPDVVQRSNVSICSLGHEASRASSRPAIRAGCPLSAG